MSQEEPTALIGPETAQQTEERDQKEFWASVEGHDIEETPEFKAAMSVAEENTRFLLTELAKEGVTVSEMKKEELLKKSKDHAGEAFLPNPKYPDVKTEWENPNKHEIKYIDFSSEPAPEPAEVTVKPKENAEENASSINEAQEAFRDAATSEKLKKYVEANNASTDRLLTKWKDTLSDVSIWKYSNLQESKLKTDKELINMTTADKIKYMGRGTDTFVNPSWVKSDGNHTWVNIGAFSQVNPVEDGEALGDHEYLTFQDAALTNLGVLKDGETTQTLRDIVSTQFYNGGRGEYQKDTRSLETPLPNGLMVKVDFDDKYFRVYADEEVLASAIDSLFSK